MIGHLTNRELVVWRKSSGTDAGGGRPTEFVQVGKHRVRVAQPSGSDSMVAQQDGALLTHQVYFDAPPLVDVQRGDELRGTHLGRPVVLVVLRAFVPSVPAYLRADCEERQAEPEE